jgi:hypothetical protein
LDNVTISQTTPALAPTETTTETFVPYTVSTPGVLIADPRATSVSFSGLTLGAGSGETNAMLCISQVTQAGVTECLLGIQSMAFPEGFNYFIVGDVFMRKYPTYFNLNDNTVSFLVSKCNA